MTVLVTRPEPQASQWADALNQAGIEALALPLIEIRGPADTQAVAHCWQTLDTIRLVMFVSPAAAQWFFQLKPAEALWPEQTLAAAPGPGTARAVTLAGASVGLPASAVLHPREDAPQFDSEALWPLLAPLSWEGQQVVIISGGDAQQSRGRAWLSDQLRAAGASVNALLTYQRLPAHWTASQQAQAEAALAHAQSHRWLFSSSESIDQLQHRFPSHPAWTASQAVVTHPKIAQRAREAGFGQVTETRPTLDSVVHTLRMTPST